jgi:hypothetical protein
MSTPPEAPASEPAPTPASPPSAPAPPAAQPPETDWKVEAQKWEKRAKENFDKAKAHDEYVESQKTEAQKVADRLAEAEKTATGARQELLRYQVAAAKNLPPTLAGRLQGSSKKELEADADALLKEFGNQQQRQTPSYDGGVRKPATAPTDMNALIRHQAGLG